MRNNYKMSDALVISVVVPLVNVLLAGNLSPKVVQAKPIVAGVGVGVGGGQDVGVVHVGVAVHGGDGPGAGWHDVVAGVDVVAAVPIVGQGEGVGVDVTHGVWGVVGEWQRIGVGGSGQAVEVVDGHVGPGQAGVGSDRLDSSLGDLLVVSLGERLGSVRYP